MAEFSYQDAKKIIHDICKTAANNGFPTRKSFMDMLSENPHIAAQGYNAFCKIFFWNMASISLYGHREEEAVNQDLPELILPPEMHTYARDVIALGVRTGQMPEPGACDLVHRNGNYVTVYSGHMVFQWDDATLPEFYCVDLAYTNENDEAAD